MLYIDIDGVLADSDGYLKTLEPRVETDTHIMFKTFAKNADKVFLNSKPLVDLSVLKTFPEFKLLSALPNRSNIDSFCATDNETELVFSKFVANKKAWVKEHIGECELIIVTAAADKAKYCKSSKDVLIDDSDKNRKKWIAAGGIAFKSIDDYVHNYNESLGGVAVMSKTELW